MFSYTGVYTYTDSPSHPGPSESKHARTCVLQTSITDQTYAIAHRLVRPRRFDFVRSSKSPSLTQTRLAFSLPRTASRRLS